MSPIQNSAVSSASIASSGTAVASRRAASASAAGAGTAGQANPPDAGASAQVSISGAGQMLNLASTQGSTPPASDARIAGLQSAIQSGQYTVDPRRIASGLLQDSKSLLTASKPTAG
ncbi:MAG: flagellar biosynthesis anti-sigma factor FlgM [Thiomonas sp.]